MAQWNKNFNPSVLIQELEKARSINNEGKPQFSGFIMMTIPPKLEEMICMHSDITREDKHGIIMQSISNAGHDTLTPETILKEINQLEREHLSSSEQNYVVATSLSFDGNRHKLPNLQINGNKIIFAKSLPKKFAEAIKELETIIYFNINKKLGSVHLTV